MADLQDIFMTDCLLTVDHTTVSSDQEFKDTFEEIRHGLLANGITDGQIFVKASRSLLGSIMSAKIYVGGFLRYEVVKK